MTTFDASASALPPATPLERRSRGVRSDGGVDRAVRPNARPAGASEVAAAGAHGGVRPIGRARSRIAWSDLFALLATRVALLVSWRDPRVIAARLEGFAATEAGSALDMLAAAERVEDPRLRRLFARHGLDEARHATLFRDAARRIDPERARGTDGYAVVRATRQNLFARLGLVRFVAFVFLSERRAARQFEMIARARPELAPLLDDVLRDERFHVAYSQHLLTRWRSEGRATEVRIALARVRAEAAWEAWRRAGRVMGDALVRVVFVALWAIVVPIFALAERRRGAPSAGWHAGSAGVRTLADARREG